jgi:hypothetical protein
MSFLKYLLKDKDKKNIKTYIYFKPTESNDLDDIQFLLNNDDKLHVYSNNEDVNLYETYKNVKDSILRFINNSEFLCKGLNPDYIFNSFEKVDAVVIIGSSSILPNGNIFGFALIKFDEDNNSLYIDVICSHIGIKGAGDVLIKKIEHITKKIYMTSIYLKSVKSAITFYEKYGFIKHDKLCDDMCLMKKSVKKNNGGKNEKQTKKSRNFTQLNREHQRGVNSNLHRYKKTIKKR